VSLAELEQGKRDVAASRRRMESTLIALQMRLRPGNLAGEAWDGVKDKSADLADGALSAVKKRPAAVSVALGAFALFLAREPIKRAVTRMVSGDEDEEGAEAEEGRVVTRIETADSQFTASAPVVDASLTEGVK
jgi:hypothetical protein